MGQSTPINRTLVLMEADVVIAGFAREHRPLNARYEAKLILKHHPDSGVTEEELAATIAAMAKERGLTFLGA